MTDPALCPPLSGGGVRPGPGGFDLSRRLRALVALIALGMSALALAAVLRALAGAAPHHPNIREVAILVHVVAVLPAIPLGGYLLLARKDTARHRALGRVWAGLMVVTALSAMFIGQRHGELHLTSLIHGDAVGRLSVRA